MSIAGSAIRTTSKTKNSARVHARQPPDITTLGTAKLRQQGFRNSRRRDFDADTYYQEPRAFGTRSRYNRAPVEAPPDPPVSVVLKWFNPEKGFGFVQLSDGSGDGFLHGSLLAQSGIRPS